MDEKEYEKKIFENTKQKESLNHYETENLQQKKYIYQLEDKLN
jgi:hypothetical protein